jgi:hypothetical protein
MSGSGFGLVFDEGMGEGVILKWLFGLEDYASRFHFERVGFFGFPYFPV